MKQKIVIKLQMECDKCRNKALKTAAEVEGVIAVSIDGEEKDRVVVTGDNVNSVCLANKLKKKFRSIFILSVEEVKKPPKEEKPKPEPKPPCCAVLCLPPPPCTKCHSTNCQGNCCDPCSKCQSPKCDGHCVLICFKCHSPNCKGKCDHHDPCSKCQNATCNGYCVTACFKCHSPKCHGQCTWSCNPPPPPPCFNQCPPWCSCPRCYIPYTPCPPYKICYDTCLMELAPSCDTPLGENIHCVIICVTLSINMIDKINKFKL